MKEMIDQLASLNASVFLVCDGAAVPGIGREFQNAGLTATPLFKERLNNDVIQAGPWIAHGERSRRWLDKAASFAQSKNVGVFWSADICLEQMERHLRSLNIASMPDSTVVYFRHYDPDGLAWLADKLHADQAARLFGPALMIAFGGGFAAGATISRPADLPEPRPGLLRFDDEQLQVFEDRNRSKSRDRIRDFIKCSFRQKLPGVNDEELQPFIQSYEKDGRRMGLTREDHLALWVHMSFESNGKSLGNKDLANAVALSSH